ncbi:MAG: NUDIX hydrolase [Acidimicrobiales bacterium]
MRDWLVAGGLLVAADEVLLVQNRRRNGLLDWSTPGGVIDAGETLIEGLTREVTEETGLIVQGWAELAYIVRVDFVDRDMTLSVEAHLADSWTGELVVDDPDGIVVEADFMDWTAAENKLLESPRWVGEPLTTWLGGGDCGSPFHYRVSSDAAGGVAVERH